MSTSLKKSFMTGIVLILPIGVTLFFIDLMLHSIGAPTSRVLFCWMDARIRNTSPIYFVANAISICLVIIIIVFARLLSKLFLGKLVIGLTDKFINHVPFVNTIDKAVKQVISTFGANRDAALSKTLLVEYPKEGSYAVGFLASMTVFSITPTTGHYFPPYNRETGH
ncbi:MAG: DUF502 domain-containing protein [Puniceicoccales bacterium]|jgi:uncharacterized membrane protein|nr:DUF502 domain-containing protein [Puniceicoccales bacterium]